MLFAYILGFGKKSRGSTVALFPNFPTLTLFCAHILPLSSFFCPSFFLPPFLPSCLPFFLFFLHSFIPSFLLPAYPPSLCSLICPFVGSISLSVFLFFCLSASILLVIITASPLTILYSSDDIAPAFIFSGPREVRERQRNEELGLL